MQPNSIEMLKLINQWALSNMGHRTHKHYQICPPYRARLLHYDLIIFRVTVKKHEKLLSIQTFGKVFFYLMMDRKSQHYILFFSMYIYILGITIQGEFGKYWLIKTLLWNIYRHVDWNIHRAGISDTWNRFFLTMYPLGIWTINF